MSDRVTIVAEPRTVTGKKVNQLRREGVVPGVIYGQSEPVIIQMEAKPLRRALRSAGTNQLATIEVGDKPGFHRIVADRGWRSKMAISPNISPGARSPTTTSPPLSLRSA